VFVGAIAVVAFVVTAFVLTYVEELGTAFGVIAMAVAIFFD